MRLAVVLVVVALVVVMMTNLAMRRRKIAGGWSEATEATDRYVDIGVTLKIVRADPAGSVLLEGARPMTVVATKYYGGILDTKVSPPRLLDDRESANPQVWLCSEDQWKVVEHGDAELVGKLALGGMGAGKTTAGVIWTYLRWLEHIGTRKEMGVTAPTETRLGLVFNEIFAMFPPEWFSFNSEKSIMTLCDGFRVRGVSTYRQSASQGSRVQAFNWVAVLMDELQDSIDEFVHIMARLRSKRDGRAKRLATVTAKDDPAFRTLKQKMIDSGIWSLHTLLGPNSPFIHPEHWENMKRLMTLLDFQRLVMAEDLPSESRVYGTFDRKYNVRPIPMGARKITSIVLARKTGDRQDALLMGHDPGSAKAATVWLDAYELPPKIAAHLGFLPNEVLWWVRAELFTLHKTHEQHATEAMAITRNRFGCNVRSDTERAHVRCQPWGQAEDKPDLEVFATWKRIGFNIKAAQYSKTGQGIGQIKKDSRISVVKTLFCDARGRRRLFLECDDQGTCATPQLMAALETMERDHRGRAEHEEKNVKHDKSDLPASLGYAVWPFEKELALALRADIRKELTT